MSLMNIASAKKDGARNHANPVNDRHAREVKCTFESLELGNAIITRINSAVKQSVYSKIFIDCS